MYIGPKARVGKTGSLCPYCRVMCVVASFSFAMNLLQGPVLPTLT